MDGRGQATSLVLTATRAETYDRRLKRMALSSGSHVGHYEVLELVGKGAMGEVYAARDSRLQRRVAIKVLPLEFEQQQDRLARFQREARALAALNHPNIVTIHAVEELEGTRFISMELVQGASLDTLIRRPGMDLKQVLDIALPLLEGLGAAHSKGIAHRDLKPANIMITEDHRVKILDFGLAHQDVELSASHTSVLGTESLGGSVVGTPSYMSPEQIQGRRADPRSDLFSIGIILHEMATGQRPFPGGNAAEVMACILRDEPSLHPELPESLSEIVSRCLAKDPAQRLQSAQEIHDQLSELSGRAPTPSPGETTAPWVAVLPFRCTSSNAELAGFGEELADDIITALSLFPMYLVIAASSTFRFKPGEVDIRDVAKQVGARYVMEGSIREAGGRLRVNVRVSDAIDGTGIWAERFNRDLNTQDIFEIQDELTDRIVGTVADGHGVLARSMAALVKAKPIHKLGPYEALLQWMAYFDSPSAAQHLRARQALERAVEMEPGSANLWAGLSAVYLDELRFVYNPRENSLDRAVAAARRAADLDVTNPLAMAALAVAHFFNGDLVAFPAAAERAMRLNPRDASMMALLGIIMAQNLGWEEGLGIIERAMSINPHHPGWYHFGHFMYQLNNRDFEQALVTAKKLNMPGHLYHYSSIAIAAGWLGLKAEAKSAVDELLAIAPDFAAHGRELYALWGHPPELQDLVIEGLRKAGLPMK